jgi:hypothetical protein
MTGEDEPTGEYIGEHEPTGELIVEHDPIGEHIVEHVWPLLSALSGPAKR